MSRWIEKPLFLTARALCKVIDRVTEWVAKRRDWS